MTDPQAPTAAGTNAGPPQAAREGPVEPVAPTDLAFDNVYVLTSTPEAPSAIPDLRLTISDTGVQVFRANGVTVWGAAWAQVAGLSAPERSRLPDGRQGLVVHLLVSGGRTHRFVVPTDDPGPLEDLLADLACRRGLTPPPTRHWWSTALTWMVVLATAAVVTALLLAAGHVITY